MQIAVLTLDGFNELDSFIAAAILNRMKAQGWAAHITAPTEMVTSMNGVAVRRQRPLDFAAEADAAAAIHYVAPVGEKEASVARALDAVRPFLPAEAALPDERPAP